MKRETHPLDFPLCVCGHEHRHHDNEATRCEVDGCGCPFYEPED